MATNSNRFLLRLACEGERSEWGWGGAGRPEVPEGGVGTVDAKEMACNGTIFLSFDMIADDDVFTAALHQVGWYASICNVPPDIGNGTGQVLCPLCPKCAAYLLGKENLKLADQALEKGIIYLTPSKSFLEVGLARFHQRWMDCGMGRRRGKRRQSGHGDGEVHRGREQSSDWKDDLYHPQRLHPLKPMLDEWQRCKRIDNLSHVMPGWGCCEGERSEWGRGGAGRPEVPAGGQCHVYNSYDRTVCKGCGHVPCYPAAAPVPVVDKQDAGWEEN